MITRAQVLTVLVVGLLCLAGCRATNPPDEGPVPPDQVASASPTRLPAIPRLPAGFPLGAGWPDRLQSPERISLVLPGCGNGAGLPPNPNGTDRLSVDWNSTGRHRQLTTYDDDAQAASVARRLVDFYRRCPVVVSHELPWRTVTSVRPAAVGRASWVVVQFLDIEGRRAAASVLLVVRIGRAVLVDQTGVEDPVGSRLRREVEGQTSRAAAVLGAMCVLTHTTC